MKDLPTWEEAVYVLGLPDEEYLFITPREFWTPEAFTLFNAARKAGIIYFDSATTDRWLQRERIGKAGLAYFCKRASKYLRLNKGSHTNWKPLEKMFNSTPPAAPLRLSLHLLDESAGQEAVKERIDKFFDTLNDYCDEY